MTCMAAWRGVGSTSCASAGIALRLELNRWNGVVEPRVVLKALCRVDPGDCRVLGESEDFWAAASDSWTGLEPGPPVRELRDRRGQGFAGVAGDLVSSGQPTL